jgi:hypothetical protein
MVTLYYMGIRILFFSEDFLVVVLVLVLGAGWQESHAFAANRQCKPQKYLTHFECEDEFENQDGVASTARPSSPKS